MKFSDLLMPNPRYATHNLTTVKRLSASPGILYPLYNRIMLPGDKFHIDLRHLIRTNPTFAPLMGSFKVRVVTAVTNLKNYAIALEGYRRSFDWRQVTLPHFGLTYSNDTTEWNTYYPPGGSQLMAVRETSLWDYLGYERGWMPTRNQYDSDITWGGDLYAITKSFLPFLGYYDFYRNYLVNPQYDDFPIFRGRARYRYNTTEDAAGIYYEDGTGYDDNDNEYVIKGLPDTYVESYSLSKLDEWFSMIHKHYDVGKHDPINFGENEDLVNRTRDFIHWTTNQWDVARAGKINDCSVYHGGLVGTLYDPDINTQWMSVENYSKLNEVRVNTQTENGQQFTSYQDIVKSSALWQFMVGEVYNSGTYADHIYSQYGVSVKGDMNIPQIVHVYDAVIRFEDITSQTNNLGADGSGAALGEQGGVGRGFGQSNRFTVRNGDNNLCMLQTFMWITPQIDYATGLPEDSNIIQLSDIYLPAFDNYSLQPRLQEQINANPSYYSRVNPVGQDPFYPYVTQAEKDADPNFTSGDLYNSMPRVTSVALSKPANAVLGYQPAFSEYKTDVNRVHGLFKNSLSYWAIVRKLPVVGSDSASTGIYAGYVYQPRYGAGLPEKDAMTYEVPFAVENEDNFFCQFVFDITAVRPLSKSALPNVK